MRQFGSFGEFAMFLVEKSASQQAALEGALRRSVNRIVETAKSELGVYQPKVNEFKAWAELADATKDDRVYQGYPENEPLLREADLRDSISGQVHGLNAAAGSNSQIAVYQELGTVHHDAEGRTSGEAIPPRAFLGPAGVRDEKQVVRWLADAYAASWTGVALLGRDSEE